MKKKHEIELTKADIRNELTAILLEIDRVAKIIGIKYFLYAGTLLGAVRHKGFIPWDDDVDICIERSEYEKLLSEFNNLANPKFKLISPYTERNYLWGYAKVINTETTLIENRLKPPFEYGLFVDIFPFDYVQISSEKEKLAIQDNLLLFNRRQMITDFRYAPLQWKICNFWNLVIYKGKNRFSYLFKDAAENNIEFNEYQKSLSPKEKNADSILVAFGLEPQIDRLLFNAKWYEEAIELDFEGHKLMAPIGYDEILTTAYGDYMQLPPENKRHGEHYPKVTWKLTNES